MKLHQDTGQQKSFPKGKGEVDPTGREGNGFYVLKTSANLMWQSVAPSLPLYHQTPPFPQSPWVCSEIKGFTEEKSLLRESVNTNDLRTAALQRRLAARGQLQWGFVLWRHKREKESRG